MSNLREVNAHSVGDELMVFDPKLWNGRDQGDNSQFWKLATIERIYSDGGRTLHDVRFEHDGRLSKGHFLDA